MTGLRAVLRLARAVEYRPRSGSPRWTRSQPDVTRHPIGGLVNLLKRCAVERVAVVLMLAVLGVVTAFTAPATAAAVLIFIDSNGNGIFDATDVDVTQTVRNGLPVETTANIVVPEGASLRLRTETVSLTGHAIQISGILTTTGSMHLRSSGPIALGPRSMLMADGVLQVTAEGDLTIDRARVQADDVVMLESVAGHIAISRSLLNGGTRLEINGFSVDGGLAMEHTTLQSPRGLLNVHVDGRVELHRVNAVARDMNFTVGGGWCEVMDSTFRVPRTGSLTMSVDASASVGPLSTLDLRGSRLYAPWNNMVLIADEVVGQ
jgi:hypothetical protein